jgi:hypothetical protein
MGCGGGRACSFVTGILARFGGLAPGAIQGTRIWPVDRLCCPGTCDPQGSPPDQLALRRGEEPIVESLKPRLGASDAAGPSLEAILTSVTCEDPDLN